LLPPDESLWNRMNYIVHGPTRLRTTKPTFGPLGGCPLYPQKRTSTTAVAAGAIIKLCAVIRVRGSGAAHDRSQVQDWSNSVVSAQAATDPYGPERSAMSRRVIQILPVMSGEVHYRIRRVQTAHEIAASESELRPVQETSARRY
jgi:hypothetical protein